MLPRPLSKSPASHDPSCTPHPVRSTAVTASQRADRDGGPLQHISLNDGKQLFISVRTVDTHRARIMRKLQLETKAELMLFALANGVIGAT